MFFLLAKILYHCNCITIVFNVDLCCLYGYVLFNRSNNVYSDSAVARKQSDPAEYEANALENNAARWSTN